MLYCENCGRPFAEDGYLCECPYCGEISATEMRQCPECEKYFPTDKLDEESGMCPLCLKDSDNQYDTFFYNLSPSRQKRIDARHEGRFMAQEAI